MITGGGSEIDLETLAKSNVGVDLFILDFDPSPEVYSGGANIQVAPPPAATAPITTTAVAAAVAPIPAAAAAAHPDPCAVTLAAQVIANWADDTVVVVPDRNDAADLGVTLDSMTWTFNDDGRLKPMISSDAASRVDQVYDCHVTAPTPHHHRRSQTSYRST